VRDIEKVKNKNLQKIISKNSLILILILVEKFPTILKALKVSGANNI
jgi:hypothetical protein